MPIFILSCYLDELDFNFFLYSLILLRKRYSKSMIKHRLPEIEENLIPGHMRYPTGFV